MFQLTFKIGVNDLDFGIYESFFLFCVLNDLNECPKMLLNVD